MWLAKEERGHGKKYIIEKSLKDFCKYLNQWLYKELKE